MRATHRRSRRPIVVAVLAAVLTVGATATTASAAPLFDNPFATVVCVKAPCEQPPINDNYLESLNLNKPGTPLNQTETLSDKRNTAGATVQSNILSPHPGPPELTGCNGVTEGKTIWYDFYPNANGLVRIRTSASFGTVMAVMPYNPKTLLPENGERKCAVNQPTAAGELFDKVQAGKSVHDPDRRRRRSRGHRRVPVRLPRPAQAPAGRSHAHRAAAVRRGERREPRRQRPPEGPRRSALHARLPPPGHHRADRSASPGWLVRCCPTAPP